MKQAYDYVVIGSGAAGSIVASRLIEDNDVRVAVIEAGGSDKSVNIRMPGALGYALSDPKRTWQFDMGPEPYLDNRRIGHERGRVLGGSSSINGMVFVRGNPRDFNSWADSGLDEWSYAQCLPYFKKFERFDQGANEYRGASGPVGITSMPADNPIYDAMLEAGQQAGHKLIGDYNAYEQEGIYKHQCNIDKGVRASAGRAYLHPALKTGKVDLQLKAQVTKIKFNGKRAVGVEYVQNGNPKFVEAEREVILCGGSFNSPHLLLLSGIGNPKHIEKFDIPVVADVPGVGRNLIDHPGAPLSYRLSRKGVSPAAGINLIQKGIAGAQWLFLRSGIGATSFFETGSMFQVQDDSGYADIQHEFLPLLGDYADGMVVAEDGFVYSINLMRPKSRGYVELSSADPLAHPKIVNNYMADEYDRRTLVAGIKHTDEIIHQKAWDGLRGEALVPEMRKLSDDEVFEWLKPNLTTQYHPVSTCRMGVDDMSVVDGLGRVHNVEGLRVVDASVMPDITTGNSHAPTLMLAEKLSDHIRGKALPSEEVPYDGKA